MKHILKKLKILSIFVFLGISSCSYIFDSLDIYQPFSKSSQITVGVLLPLSGNYKQIGNKLLQAINIGYHNANNNHMVLKIYDTKSNPKSAKKVTRKAIREGAKIIIGPLLSSTTKASLLVTESYDIPLLTFSNNIENLKNTKNVYTLAYLPSSEIEAMITFAIKKKHSRNFEILAPENKYGELAVATAKKSLELRGLAPLKVVYYPETEFKLAKYLKHLVPEKEEEKYQKALENIRSGKVILAPDQKVPYPKLDFDALIIADFGKKLNIVISHLPFLDIDYKSLTILGNSHWGNPTNLQDPILQGAYFTSYGDGENSELYTTYQTYYQRIPNLLEYSAYDSIMLVSSLIYKEDEIVVSNFTESALTEYKSDKPSLGNFILRKDGTNARQIIINRISRNKAKAFYSELDYNDYMKIDDYQKLEIIPFKQYIDEQNKKALESLLPEQ